MLPVSHPHALGHLLFPKPQGFWECLLDAKDCWAACEQHRQTLTSEGEDSGYKHPTSTALGNFSGWLQLAGLPVAYSSNHKRGLSPSSLPSLTSLPSQGLHGIVSLISKKCSSGNSCW
ncbi:hypothetical protein H1C71_003755 [Ictidomys tridecemlineatus]|nr:hypothetical protein H1C71_003755 [Ictidomys tridecemlineatus]